MEKKKQYETRDIDEAAYLKTIGFELANVWLEPGARRVTVFFRFIVPENVDMEQTKRDFTNRKSLVEPKFFAANLKEIQDILFDCLRQQAPRKGNS